MLGTINTNGTLSLPLTSSIANGSVLGGAGKVVIGSNGGMTFNGGPSYIRTTVEVGGSFSGTAAPGASLRFDAGGATVRVLSGGTASFRANGMDASNGGIGVVAETGGIVNLTASGGAVGAAGGTINVTNDPSYGTTSTLTGSINNATINSGAGSLLNVGNNSTVNVSGDILGTGSGRVVVQSNSTLNVAADAKLNFPAGVFYLNGSSTVAGPGTLTNNGSISVLDSTTIRSKVLNYGTYTNHVGTRFAGATGELRNKAGGTINGDGGFDYFDSTATAPGLFLDSGSTLQATTGGIGFGGLVPLTINDAVIKTSNAFYGLSFSGQNTTINGVDFQVAGGGRLTFGDGSVTTLGGTIKGSGAIDQVSFLGGSKIIAAGGAVATTTPGLLRFVSPQIDGPGKLTINSGSSVGVFGTPVLTTEILVNGGFNLDRGSNPSLILNTTAALLHIGPTGSMRAASDSNGQNIYTTTASTPGAMKIDSGGLFFRDGNGAFTNMAISVPVDSLGTIRAAGIAIIQLTGPLPQFTGTAGDTTRQGGRFEILDGGSLDLNGRTINTLGPAASVLRGGNALRFPALNSLNNLQGSLELTQAIDLPLTSALVNSGTLKIGAGSDLSVGSYTQSAAGKIEFVVNGTGNEDIGQLDGSGPATLAGTAIISAATGYTPAANSSFALQTFTTRNGTYTAVQGLNLPSGANLDPIYTNTSFSVNTVTGGSADLAVTAITPPASGAAGQNVTVTYTVTNNGGPTGVGNWTDTIYLSKDGGLSGDDIILTQVAHTGSLSSGLSYTGDVTVPLVGVLPGNYHFVIVADSRGNVADVDRSNNTAASADRINVTIPALTPGVATSGTIKAGRNLYYAVTLPTGKTPTFTFTGAVAGAAEIFQSLGQVPTIADFDSGAFNAASTVQRVTGVTTARATYFVLLRGRENAGSGAIFSLLADGVGLSLTASSATRGSNVGRVTTTLTGTQLTADTTFKLVGAATRTAAASMVLDGTTATATFDLTGLTAGNYGIVATNASGSATLANAITVVANGTVGRLTYALNAPRGIRPPFSGVAATLTYSNPGGTDIGAPLFVLTGENVRMRLAGQRDFVPATYTLSNGRPLATFDLLGVSGGAAGTLSPGESGRIDVVFEPIDANSHAISTFNAYALGPNSAAPIHTDGLKDELRPDGIPADAWEAVFANFKAGVGGTVGSYTAMLDDNANYLSQFGPVSADTYTLLQFEIEQADDFGGISSRYVQGALGRGSVTPFSSRVAEVDGIVTITEGASTRLFRKAGSTYRSAADDAATLTKSGPAFTLTEANGRATRFRADGRIDFVQSSAGQRTTAAYDGGGRLVSTTLNSTGDVMAYAYTTQGRIASVTDSVGRVTSFAYDAAGEHLLSVGGPTGTTTLTYVTGQGGSREHALQSVTTPSGVTTSYAYDARGRVVSRTVGTGVEAVTTTYTHTGPGRITVRDSAGNASDVYQGLGGTVARTIDAAGSGRSSVFDADGRITGVVDANGLTSAIGFGDSNLADTLTNPDRSRIGIETDGDPLRITRITNPNGGITRFDHDGSGNLTGVALPDGSGVANAHDAFGRITARIDANGQRTTFTYNAAGLVSRKAVAGGPTVDYTYDAHRNLITATDASGTTGFTYDAADRLTGATYANGRSVRITYDAFGRRASITDGSGYAVKYAYDSRGNVAALRDGANALIVSYAYDANGRLKTETRGNGSTTAYAYDSVGRMATIVHRNAASAVVAQFAYTYDALDHAKTVVGPGGTTTYTYDLHGQLTAVSLPGGRTIAYAYDANGNRTSVTDSAGGTANYSTKTGDAYTAAGSATMTYDAAGQLRTRMAAGSATTYAYDTDGKLASVTKPGSSIAYEYDALGNRTAKTENGVRTDYAIDPVGLGLLFGEYTGVASANYANGQGIAARTAAGSTSYYHYDAAGNTVALTGASGSATDAFAYLPFGETLSRTGSTQQPFTFDGRLGVTGDATGLFDMRNRTYDPALGRFTTRDPLGISGGDTNLYRFVGNDPVNRSDPAGLIDVYGGASASFILGSGVNVGSGYYANSDDPYDSGIYLSGGFGGGLDIGFTGTVGQSTDISGYAGPISAGVGSAVSAVTYDFDGNVTGGAFGISGGSNLVAGASYSESQTIKLSARSLLNALGFPPAQAGRPPPRADAAEAARPLPRQKQQQRTLPRPRQGRPRQRQAETGRDPRRDQVSPRKRHLLPRAQPHAARRRDVPPARSQQHPRPRRARRGPTARRHRARPDSLRRICPQQCDLRVQDRVRE